MLTIVLRVKVFNYAPLKGPAIVIMGRVKAKKIDFAHFAICFILMVLVSKMGSFIA